MRRGILLLGAASLLFAGAAGHPARAATHPRVVVDDPSADELDQRPSMDLRRVTLEVRKLRAGDPVPSIVVTMNVGAVPEKQAVTYAVTATIPDCGAFTLYWTPGTVLSRVLGESDASLFVCTGTSDELGEVDDVLTPKATVGPSSITWSIPVDSLSKAARKSGVLTDIASYTAVAEPVLGLDTTNAGVADDSAQTDKELTFS